MVKRFFGWIMHKNVYKEIPYDDVLSRQQFILFRIFSITAFVAAIGDIIPRISYNLDSIDTRLVILLSAIIFLNYAFVGVHKKLKFSYFTLMMSGFLIIHIVSYTAGGVRMAGVLYYGVIILSSFMLLGTRGGMFFIPLGFALLTWRLTGSRSHFFKKYFYLVIHYFCPPTRISSTLRVG